MTGFFYDFHIHSALSPCANDEMTPNNIVNMAVIKGLDVIAVCDHNCADNTPAVAEVAKECGLMFLPGIEVSTAEEVHVLVLFDKVENAVCFGNIIYDSLPDIDNNPDFFGNQLVMDGNDAVIGKKDKLLLSASNYTLAQCFEMCKEHNGVAVPAHVNKEANSVIANLGFFPPDIDIPTVEVWGAGEGVALDQYNILRNSDAHTLGDISEQSNSLHLAENNIGCIIKKLCAKKDNL